MTVVLEAEAKERFLSRIKCTDDPTSTPPEFAFTASESDRPSTWVDGQWDGSAAQQGSTWIALAMTPLVGFTGSGAAVALEAGQPSPWVRVTVGDEQFVRRLPKITVRG